MSSSDRFCGLWLCTFAVAAKLSPCKNRQPTNEGNNDKCLGELFLKSFNLFYFKLLIAPFLRHNGTATAEVCRRNWNENYDFIGRLLPWFPAFDWSPDKIKSINFPLSDWQLLKTNHRRNFPTSKHMHITPRQSEYYRTKMWLHKYSVECHFESIARW